MNGYAIGPFIVAFSTLAFGSFTLLSNLRGKLNWLFFGICFSVFIWAYGYSRMYNITGDPAAALAWARIGYAGVPFIPVFVYHFIITFLKLKRPAAIIVLTYLVGISFLIIGRTDLFLKGMYEHYFWGLYPKAGPLYIVFVLFFSSIFLRIMFLLYRELRHHQATQSPLQAEQMRYVLVGFALATTSLIDYIPNYGFEIYPWAYLSAFGWLIAMGWACFRHRLLDIHVVITRAAVFAGVYTLVLGIPLLCALKWQSYLESFLGARWWAWLLVIYAVLATAAHYANQYLQRRAGDRLLAEQRRYQQTLRRASTDMTRIRGARRLQRVIVSVLTSTMRVSHASLYLQDEEGKHYDLKALRGRNSYPGGTRVDAQSPLVKHLQKHRAGIVREELLVRQSAGNSTGLREVTDQMTRLGSDCVVPSFSRDRLLGFVALGAKRSGQMYTESDLQNLETLGNQAALAIENTDFYEAEKTRQAQMFHKAQLASLGSMAGGMSHQINNRFHVQAVLADTMRIFLESLDHASPPEKIQKAIEKSRETFDKLAKDAVRGGEIAKNLLKFAKPGKTERISFTEAIEQSIDLCQYLVSYEEFEFERVVQNPLPLINGNLNQLTEILNNLITNGYDAIKRKESLLQDKRLSEPSDGEYLGKIRLEVSAFTDDNDAPWLKIVFSDNGSGMTPEEMKDLFVPFFTTKGSEKGTGLGLYVIRMIAQNHGGDITVESEYGEGSVFTITLPGVKQSA